MTIDTNNYEMTRDTHYYGTLRGAFWFITSNNMNICIINFKPKKKCLKKIQNKNSRK